MLTFPLTEFCNTITAFDGQFCINDRLYSSVLPSTNSLYFFNEANEDDYMLIFDPIIDIKQRSSAFIVFYYPNHVINVSLKEAHVTKEPFEKDSKG